VIASRIRIFRRTAGILADAAGRLVLVWGSALALLGVIPVATVWLP
jgi:hypothetical protein